MSIFPVITSTLSPTALGEFISQRYQLKPNVRCELVKTGMNHTYKITAGDTRYVARVYCFQWRSRSAIHEEIQLLGDLSDHGISVSYAISDKEGHYIQEVEAPEGIRFLVLFSFAAGQKVRWMNTNTCAAVGEMMAKFHQFGPKQLSFRETYHHKTLFEWPIELLKGYFSVNLPEMKYLEELGKRFENSEFHNLETGTVHLDIWYDNLSVDNETDITLFDFDFCGNGYYLLDVAYSCMQLFLVETGTGQFEVKREHFLKGYQKYKALSEQELQKIPLAGAAVFVFYLGVQAERFDWSNNFFTENYLKMFVGKIKSWLDYHS